MSETYVSSVQLFDLNEDILHEIFGYLRIMHLYFSVRKVCKDMKHIVDGFISMTGKFVLANRTFDTFQSNNDFTYGFTKIFYLFKTRSNGYLFYSKTMPELPPSPQTLKESNEIKITNTYYIGTFGGIIRGDIIVGYYCKETVIKAESRRWLGTSGPAFKATREFYRLVPHLFQYNKSSKNWDYITTSQERPIEFEYQVACHLTFCSVDDFIMVGLDIASYDGGVMVNNGHNTNHNGSDKALEWIGFKLIRFQFPYYRGNPRYITPEDYLMKSFSLPFPIKGIKYSYTINVAKCDHSLTYEESRIIFLHGYTLINGHFHFFFCQVKPNNEDKRLRILNDSVSYTVLSEVQHINRSVSFILYRSIYIIGWFDEIQAGTVDFRRKLRCDRYDIVADKYHKNFCLVPSFVENITSVVTSSKDLWALLLTNAGLCIFTEKHGFDCVVTGIPYAARSLKEEDDFRCEYIPFDSRALITPKSAFFEVN